eukprot:6727765-Prorocentrum_lima.AAC.1
MAHTGQVDGLEGSEPEEQSPECSKRQGVKMLKGVSHMMKQQLKELKLSLIHISEPTRLDVI